MRFNTNVSANSKKSVELNNFLGVDFSSAPTNVSNKRASFAKNLLSIDGVNQKRPGWEELFNFGEGKPINGVFVNKFKRNGVIDEIMLVQAAGILYRVTYDAEKENYITHEIEMSSGDYVTYTDRAFNSQAFMSKNRLYIIGGGGYYVYAPQENYESFVTRENYITSNGDYSSRNKIYNKGDLVEYNGYVFVCRQDNTDAYFNKPSGVLWINTDYWWCNGEYYQLRNVVDDKDTYVPTTTIGIMPNESGDTARMSLDKINLLCSYRINKLRGVGEDVLPSEVYLDTYDETAKEGKVYYILNENGEFTQAEVMVGDSLGGTHFQSNGYYEKYSAYTFKLDADKIKLGSRVTITINESLALENDYSLGGQIYYGGTNNDRFLFGSGRGYLDVDKGIMYLFDSVDITPQVATEDNISVLFSPYDADSSIINCEFGCVFGYNGRDTLFLSGNKNYPNQDFYSYTVEEDFTYFPADNIEKFGSSATSVKAYLRVADGTLAVLKETSNTEPTIYYRSASYVTNALGITEILFPVIQGAFGEGAINAHTVGTLIGDNLFVSPNGVFGLTLADNVVVNERYAKERDKFIHSQLIKHDLTNAVAVVYQGRYWLSIDGVCYVMDARFKSTSAEDKDDTFSYECYYLDNIPAKCFLVYNNELYFGTADGGLCRFKNDSYKDEKIQDMGIPAIEDSLVTVSEEFGHLIKDGNKMYFSFQTLYSDGEKPCWRGVYTDLVEKQYVVLNSQGAYQYVIQFEESIENEFKIGQEICVYDDNMSFGVEVTDITSTNFLMDTIVVSCGSSIYVKPENLKILKTNLKDRMLYIGDFDGKNSFNIYDEEGNKIQIYKVTIPTRLHSQMIWSSPIQAIWQSAVLDLGLYDYSKCLDSLSVVLSPDFSGKVRFGYETKWVTLDLIAKQIKSAETETSHHFFSFDNINFDNFTFETAFASSYTKRIRERNINYIMFKAVMDDDLNSALMSIKVDYTIYKKNRGVR